MEFTQDDWFKIATLFVCLFVIITFASAYVIHMVETFKKRKDKFIKDL